MQIARIRRKRKKQLNHKLPIQMDKIEIETISIRYSNKLPATCLSRTQTPPTGLNNLISRIRLIHNFAFVKK